jgi:small nuclear ribonucleoprotein (snRNP)-like protein
MATVPEGPLRLLAQWAAQGARVRVVTRHAAGVRGSATGLLRCFDRHMNLLLEDVAEVYTVMLKVPRIRPKGQGQGQQAPGQGQHQAPEQQQGREQGEQEGAGQQAGPRQQVRWCRKQDRRQRQLAQIFIKGDNVVMVAAAQLAQPEGQAAGEQRQGQQQQGRQQRQQPP